MVKNKIKITKKHFLAVKRGSILAYSLIILTMMVAIVATMSITSITEKKSASSTDFSVQAYQTADSGAQLAIKKISADSANTITQVFNSPSCDPCTDGGNLRAEVVCHDIGPLSSPSPYTISFFSDKEGTEAKKINSCGETVSNIRNIKSVGKYKDTVRAVQVAVNNCGADVPDRADSTIIYKVISAKDGKCWLDRNLGAAQVAAALNDSQSYGWYFQWGRDADGHQIATSTTEVGPSNLVAPGANFILCDTYPFDWLSPQESNLWQGESGVNNPCPTGFRLPTKIEWEKVVSAEGITDSARGFNSSLKLVASGFRNTHASFEVLGNNGDYWSSDVNESDPSSNSSYSLILGDGSETITTNYVRGMGFPVRCIKNPNP